MWTARPKSVGSTAATAKPAPSFALPTTSGTTIDLAKLRGQNVLLYFSEGVGCDACFYQTVELEKNKAAFAAKDLTLLPIVMNPADETRQDMARFKLTTPYLIDGDGSVSRAYGVLGKGMHAGLPGHGFVLIDKDGRQRWQGEYPSMFVSAKDLLAIIRKNV